jgi:hypothetical protein
MPTYAEYTVTVKSEKQRPAIVSSAATILQGVLTHNCTFPNGTLQNGTLQNGTSQNGTAFAKQYSYKTVHGHKTAHASKRYVTERYSYKMVHRHCGMLQYSILQSQSTGLLQPMDWLCVKANLT